MQCQSLLAQYWCYWGGGYIRLLKCIKGAYTAELAVILPIIIFITAGGMIFSLSIWAHIVVVDAAREGARYEALNLGSADTKVDEVLSDGNLNVANKQSVSVIKDANYVTVTVKYNQPSVIPGLPQLLGHGASWGNSFLIESSQVFKLEKP
ncbi:TadE family protein [Desulfofarcimen acetoxidans]|uniref:TadE family protein n=1 Tax=Desulfofarcimen acetoxidans TaxID=58138 RepID=UPI0012FEF149|nr:TadE family protein [Desulfofarcimen acetoxidans]